MKRSLPSFLRLLLRAWSADDRGQFADLNRDPRVAEFLQPPLTRRESDELFDRIRAHWDEQGFGLWAVAEIVSFTSEANVRSQRVMRRLGMTHDSSDVFDHPGMEGDPLERHVLSRLRSPVA